MDVLSFALPGVKLFVPRRHGDDRGYFAEIYRADLFAQHVGPIEFVQDNESLSARKGTVRGLHFQLDPAAQGKLVRCTSGSLFDVVVDIRKSSPTFGKFVSAELSAANGHQLWVPPGLAHGFCTLEPNTVINYKVSAYYSAPHDRGLAWDDPEVGVVWPELVDADTLSAKDRAQPRLAQLIDLFQ